MTIALRSHIENMIIGKPEKQVVDLLEERQINYRLLRSDSTNFCITDDIDPTRFNLEADNSIITNITFG
jgi:hypothetical protein